MTKTWDTKGKIVDLVSKKRMTLSEISEELDLAPSTVNQHIKELLSVNAIRQVDNPYIIKWKYYERDPNFKEIPGRQPISIMASPLFKVATAIVLLLVVGVGLIGISGGTKSAAAAAGQNQTVQQYLAPGAVPSGVTVFSISDSPTVSSVGAVNFTVTKVAIRSAANGTWYVAFNGTKAFDLVKLDNISQVISGASLPAGSYDEIRLYITNVTAVVDNQSTSVFVPSGVLMIFGAFNVSDNGTSTSWVNVDLNLDKSLHFTRNGSVIMLPVLGMRDSEGIGLNVNGSGILNAPTPWQVSARAQAAMDVNGNMNASTVPPQPGAPCELTAQGRVVVLATPAAYGTVTIHTPRGLLIVTNATNLTNSTADIESNISVTNADVPGAMGRAFIHCEYNSSGKLLECSSPSNLPSMLQSALLNSSNRILATGGVRAGAWIGSNITINGSRISGYNNVWANSSGRPTRIGIGAGWNANVTANGNAMRHPSQPCACPPGGICSCPAMIIGNAGGPAQANQSSSTAIGIGGGLGGNIGIG